jgi:F0F1-type ATP synthase assembly protein I
MQIPTHPMAETATGILALGASAVVTVVQSRFDPDIVAVLGAMLAAVIAVIEARKSDRSMPHTVAVLIASAFIGAVLPGAIIWSWWPDKVANMSWHLWAALGFVFGLLGWAVTAAIMALKSRVPWAVNQAANKYLPPGPKDDGADEER